jgi:glycosyltransferase involved in cell wall biosynthesis
MKIIASCAICAIYILASRTEGMPRVLLAMAAARPVIASNVGGVRHCVIDNDNGLLFASGNVEELAEKMVYLLRDNQLRNRLGRRGYERIFSDFDVLAYVRAFSEMLRQVQNTGYK